MTAEAYLGQDFRGVGRMHKRGYLVDRLFLVIRAGLDRYIRESFYCRLKQHDFVVI